MRIDATNYLDYLDAHVDELAASGAIKVSDLIASDGIVLTFLKGTLTNGQRQRILSTYPDPKRLRIATTDACPKFGFTVGEVPRVANGRHP